MTFNSYKTSKLPIVLTPNKELSVFKGKSNLSNESIYLNESQNIDYLVFGPYLSLPEGPYEIKYNLSLRNHENVADGEFIVLDISSNKGEEVIESRRYRVQELISDQNNIYETINVDLMSDVDDVETRARTNSSKVGVSSIEIKSLSGFRNHISNLTGFESLLLALLGVFLIILFSYKVFNSLSIFNLSIIIFGLILGAFFVAPKHDITGDEPHYLFNTKNMIVNKTIEVDKAYTPEIMSEFWPGEIDKYTHMHRSAKTGQYYSHHGYAVSLFLVPGYLIGGELGAKMMLAIIAGFSAVFTLWLLNHLSNDKSYSFAVTLFTFLFTPLIYYSYSIYPEIIAVFTILLGFIASLKKSTLLKVLSLIVLGLLIFFKTKYLTAAFFTAVFVLTSYYLEERDKGIALKKIAKNIVLLAMTYLISITIYFLVNYLLFGEISIFSYYTGGGIPGSVTDSDISSIIEKFSLTLLANIFDSRSGILVWLPVVIYFPLGLLSLFNKQQLQTRIFSIFALASITSYILFYSLSGSLGGASPPIRPWIAVLPLILIITAMSKDFIKRKLIVFVLAVISAYQIIGSYIYETTIVNVYSHEINPFFVKTGSVFFNIGHYLPSVRGNLGISLIDLVAVLFVLCVFFIIYSFSVDFQRVATSINTGAKRCKMYIGMLTSRRSK